ncbi:MAG: cssR [Clostridiaceae bacterium]|jgi:two-component system response regulator CssR|nr:cssR [Clostridiaceae bacterium]
MMKVIKLPMKIYLVEDERSLNILLEKYLQREGYEVTTFFDGRSAVAKIKDEPDLWILDIMLPDIDGYEIIKAIKGNNSNTPVIFMSARNEELDRVVGLELGSDDYLSKPFLPRELVIRTNMLLKRIYGQTSNDVIDEEFNFSGYRINKKQRTVFNEDEEIQLTNKEFELLNYFVENKNNLISRDQILISVWGQDYFGSDRVVDDTIRRLRKKVDRLNIETVYGYGYKLVLKL